MAEHRVVSWRKEHISHDRQSEVSKEGYIPPFYFPTIYAGFGENHAVFEWLDEAYEERDEVLGYS